MNEKPLEIYHYFNYSNFMINNKKNIKNAVVNFKAYIYGYEENDNSDKESSQNTIITELFITEKKEKFLTDFYQFGKLIEENITINQINNKSIDEDNISFDSIKTFIIQNINYNECIIEALSNLITKYGWFDFTNDFPRNNVLVIDYLTNIYSIYIYMEILKLINNDKKRVPKIIKYLGIKDFKNEKLQFYLNMFFPEFADNIELYHSMRQIHINNEKEEFKVSLYKTIDYGTVIGVISNEIQNKFTETYKELLISFCENCGRLIQLKNRRQKFCIPETGSPDYFESLECFNQRERDRKRKNKSINKE